MFFMSSSIRSRTSGPGHTTFGIKLITKHDLFMYWCQVIYSFLSSKPDEYAGLRYEPKMADLMNEIAVKFPGNWKDIGRGLGLEEYEQG